MTCPECDDLHALLRAVERALRNPKVRRDEIADAVQIALGHEHGIEVHTVTQRLKRLTQGRGGTRPPARRGVGW